MKLKNTIYIVIMTIVALFSSWTVPALVRKMTDGASTFPLMYYSSQLKELCVIDFREMKDSFADIRGNMYPRSQYDSLLPLLNFRQLAMNGAMPDTIDGHAIDMKELRIKQVMFRFRPVDAFSPQPQMGVLIEAMPKRGKLLLPGDYFRMEDNGISFVDAETNSVNTAKSRIFTDEMKKKGFEFPARNYWGNPTTRKSYEEGYFCLDSKNELYHLKMVNGRPFVKNTGIGGDLGIKWFVMSEVPDKRFYGYLFGYGGEMGILESTEDGGYRFQSMDIRPVDISKDEISILGNVLYWTVKVTDGESMDCFGLKTSDLSALSSYHQDRKPTLWDNLSEYIFPVVISPQSSLTGYVGLYISSFSPKALIVSLVLGIMVFVLLRKRVSLPRKLAMSLLVLLTGVSGLVVLVLMPYEK